MKNNHPKNPEARIDQVLQALRNTEPPTGLEARIETHIAARIANVSEVRPVATSHSAVLLKTSFSAATLNTSHSAANLNISHSATNLNTSHSAVILNAVKDLRILLAEAKLYTFAATTVALLLMLSLFALHFHHKPHTIAQSKPTPNKPYPPAQPFTLSQASGLGNIRVPQGFSLGSHTANQRNGALTPVPSQQPTDPDAIALAETLAPSRPPPPMPLTPQERLMLSVLHHGDQQEIAALDPVKRDALFAQDQAAFQNFFAPPTLAPNPGDKK